MEEAQIVIRLLIPADEQMTEAIHPRMHLLHDPALRRETGLPFDSLGFFASCANLGSTAELCHTSADLVIVIAFVQTEPLRMFVGRCRPLDDQGRNGLASQLPIMPMGSGDNDAKRDAVSFGQDAALYSPFATICRIGSGFFPRPTEPWSLLHPD
jgi:hypothetical protein